MFLVIVAAIAAVALAGLCVQWILNVRGSNARITRREYLIGIAISLVVAVLVAWGGWALVRDSKLTFREYWNGWEVAAVKE